MRGGRADRWRVGPGSRSRAQYDWAAVQGALQTPPPSGSRRPIAFRTRSVRPVRRALAVSGLARRRARPRAGTGRARRHPLARRWGDRAKGPARAPGYGGHPSEARCAVGSWGRQRSRLAPDITLTGSTERAIASGGHGPQRNPVLFPHSHSIPTSFPNKFPRIDVRGRALGQDEIDAAIQTMSSSKVRRVDFGGCGPPQQPKVRVQCTNYRITAKVLFAD
jgi:hypothetical protein